MPAYIRNFSKQSSCRARFTRALFLLLLIALLLPAVPGCDTEGGSGSGNSNSTNGEEPNDPGNSGNSGGNNTIPQEGKELTVIAPGVFSVDGEDFFAIVDENEEGDLWIAAGQMKGESLGSMIKRRPGTTSTSIYGYYYVNDEGDCFTLTLTPDGHLDSVDFSDGTQMHFSNSNGTTADVVLTDPKGVKKERDGFGLGESYKQLQYLVSTNSLFIDTDHASESGNGVTLRSDARLYLRIGAVAAKVVGCAGATLLVSMEDAYTALMTCGDACGGILNTGLSEIEFAGDGDSIQFVPVSVRCKPLIPAHIAVCQETMLDLVEEAVEGCIPTSEHYQKVCNRGDLFWYSDCGKRNDLAEDCPCACSLGACLPISACGGELTIKLAVDCDAPQNCAAVGADVFFTPRIISGGSGGPYVYKWDFGDGFGSAQEAVSHRFMSEGTYTVTLTVADDRGNFGFTSKKIIIGNCGSFSAHITADAGCVAPNSSITFTAAATGADPGQVGFDWDFGDGNTAQGPEVEHSYSAAGTYSVLLTAYYGDESDTDTLDIQVGDCGSVPLNITASASPTCIAPTKNVQFSAVASGGTGAYSFSWVFGDESGDSGANPVHAYDTSGDYTAVVTVSDESGSTAQDSVDITVGNCDPGNNGGDDATMTGMVDIFGYFSERVYLASIGARVADLKDEHGGVIMSNVPMMLGSSGSLDAPRESVTFLEILFGPDVNKPGTYSVTDVHIKEGGKINIHYSTPFIKNTDAAKKPVVFEAYSGKMTLEQYGTKPGDTVKGNYSVFIQGERKFDDNPDHNVTISGTLKGSFQGVLQ